ncbi:YceI family protein [Mangrovibacterium sp.]|uniref:YceI family protein n=1 Tax=Mangrovibacterium sp. TaxID=1961364 RepID=UPI0035617CD4
MKTIKILAVLFFSATLSLSAQKSEVNISKSTVEWTGKKIGGAHNGDVKIKSAFLDFRNDEIVGAKVVIDMTSITNADLEDEGYKQKLIGHLKSDDFFGVEKFPTASFEVAKSTKFKDGKASVTGNLTIKGKTEEITVDVFKEGAKYSAQLKVDRSKFDVRYGSNSFFDNLGDKAIDDIFILDIKLTL